MIVRASLLSIDGKPLHEAGTPLNGTDHPTAYPVPQGFESCVKLALLTNDTIRTGVRLPSKQLYIPAALSSAVPLDLKTSAPMHALWQNLQAAWQLSNT